MAVEEASLAAAVALGGSEDAKRRRGGSAQWLLLIGCGLVAAFARRWASGAAGAFIQLQQQQSQPLQLQHSSESLLDRWRDSGNTPRSSSRVARRVKRSSTRFKRHRANEVDRPWENEDEKIDLNPHLRPGYEFEVAAPERAPRRRNEPGEPRLVKRGARRLDYFQKVDRPQLQRAGLPSFKLPAADEEMEVDPVTGVVNGGTDNMRKALRNYAKTWQEYYQVAEASYKEQEWDRAKQEYLNALDVLRVLERRDRVLERSVFMKVGTCCFHRFDIRGALREFLEVKRQLSLQGMMDTVESAGVTMKIAQCYDVMTRFNDTDNKKDPKFIALRHFEEAARLLKNANGLQTLAGLRLMTKLASTQIVLGLSDEAVANLRRAVNTAQFAEGLATRPEAFMARSLFGRALAEQGDLEQAMEVLSSARAAIEARLTLQSDEGISVLLSMAVLQLRRGGHQDLKGAKDNLHGALGVFKDLPRTRPRQIEACSIFRALAEAYKGLGNLRKALEIGKLALERLEAVKRYETKEGALTEMLVGRVYAEINRNTEKQAIWHLKRSLKLWNHMPKQTEVEIFKLLGDLNMKLGDDTKALRWYDIANEMRANELPPVALDLLQDETSDGVSLKDRISVLEASLGTTSNMTRPKVKLRVQEQAIEREAEEEAKREKEVWKAEAKRLGISGDKKLVLELRKRLFPRFKHRDEEEGGGRKEQRTGLITNKET